MVIVGAIPLVSAGLYLGLGTPAALPPHRPVASELSDTVSSGQTPSVAALVAQLEQKLAANPSNAEGWALAGATYMRLGRFEDAERAYQTLHQLVGDDPQVLTAWADAALMANDGAFSPQIRMRIERALALHPDHDNAWWPAGGAAMKSSTIWWRATGIMCCTDRDFHRRIIFYGSHRLRWWRRGSGSQSWSPRENPGAAPHLIPPRSCKKPNP